LGRQRRLRESASAAEGLFRGRRFRRRHPL